MKLRIFLLLGGLLALVAKAQTSAYTSTNLWEFMLPGGITESSPALAPDGTVYQATFHGWLLAVTSEGRLKWKFKAGREIKSSPAVAADGTIYFGARDRKLYALGPQGKLKWSFTTGAWVDSSPAIATDGTVYFGSWDGNFYALDSGGVLKWKFGTGGVVFSSPAIALDGTVYFGSHDKYFYALTPNGKLKWKFPTGAEITASPAIGADGTIYFSSTDGNFYALKPDGTEQWRLHTGGYTSSSPVLDEQGNLYLAVNTERCSFTSAGKARGRIYSSYPVSTSVAVAAGGRIFSATLWSDSGMFNPDYKNLWLYPAGAGYFSSANISPRGVIYIPDDHKLIATQPPEAAPPAKSSWPLWRADSQHTGRAQK
jgi:outer membrane protein assembly factor BamB